MNKFIGFWICCLFLGMAWGCDDDDKVKADNLPVVSLGSKEFKTLENVTPFRIPVVLSVAATQQVTVTGFVKSEDGAKDGVDYSFVSREIVIPAGKSNGYFEIEVTDYPEYRPDRSFDFEIVGVKGARFGALESCRVTIMSSEGLPVLGMASTMESVGEEMRQLEVKVQTDRVWNEAVPFKLRLLPEKSTAVYGEHYVLDTTQVYTIAAGDTSVIIPVTIVDNIEQNENRYFEFEIYGNQNSVLSEIFRGMKITILDDEEPVFVCFDKTSLSAAESEGPVWLPIRVKGNSRVPVKVNLDVRGGTTEEGTDFTFEQKELVFPVGAYLDSVRIDFIDNTVNDLDRNLLVGFAAVEGAVLASSDTLAEVKIMNDDFDFTQLYEDLMGEWTLKTNEGTYAALVSGGDTPAEEDENYLKRLIITVDGLDRAGGGPVKIPMAFDVETGSMSVIMHESIKSDISYQYDHVDIVLFVWLDDEKEKVDLEWNKSYTSCTWNVEYLIGYLCPTGTIEYAGLDWMEIVISGISMSRNN